MTLSNPTSPRSNDEIRIFSRWAFWLFGVVSVTVFVLFVTIIGMDRHAPTVAIRCLLGVLAGLVIGCYAVLIGYVNQDAGRRNMSRLLWTIIAIFVPNGLGVVLYFVLRKPRIARCPQCDGTIEPGFSFCPRCRSRLRPICPHCQRSVDVGDKFCPYCGGDLAPATGATVPPLTTQP